MNPTSALMTGDPGPVCASVRAAVDRLKRIPNHDKGPVASNLLVALAETQRWSQVAELLSRDVRDFPEGNLARLALMAPEGQVLGSVVALVKGGQNLPRVLNNLGVRHLRAGHLDEAREPLRRAVDQRTLYVNARVNLATVAYRQGELQEALVEMTRASESAPAEPLVCSNLGAILCETGDPIVAEQWLTRAVQRDPHNPAVLINLGNCYALQVKYEEALEAYRTAARREEATAMADYNAALVQIECGEYESAAQHLQAAHTRAPEDADILNNLGFIFWHQKDYDRADEAFRRAAELDPSGTSAGNLVCVELAAGRAGEALELLQHADYDPVEVAFDKGLAHLLAALSIDREAGATQRRLYDHHLQTRWLASARLPTVAGDPSGRHTSIWRWWSTSTSTLRRPPRGSQKPPSASRTSPSSAIMQGSASSWGACRSRRSGRSLATT